MSENLYKICIYYLSIYSVPPFSILNKDKSPGQNQQNGIYPSCWFSSIDFTDFCFEAKSAYLYGSNTMKMNTKGIEHSIISTKIYRFMYVRSRFYVLVWHETTYSYLSYKQTCPLIFFKKQIPSYLLIFM